MSNSNNQEFKAISLFSGMGGDSLGIVQSGIKLEAYSENKERFRDTHDLNFTECKLIGKKVKSDILKVTDEELKTYKGSIDLVFAGFPCQGFSTAGKKQSNDPRNSLFREFVRTAKLVNPDVIIGENVKGLLSRKTDTNQKYIDVIVSEFQNLGYSLVWNVFKCNEFGVPQNRERLIIVGIKTDKLDNYNLSFPDPTYDPVDLKNIVKFNMKGAIKVADDMFRSLKIPNNCILSDLNNEENENNPHPYLKSKINATGSDLSYNGKSYDFLFSFSKRISPIHCEIVDIRNPSKTIICTYEHQPRLFVPLQNKNGYFFRALLPDELKQIQGFPENFQLAGNVKEQIIQIGNAVPPPLIKKIVKHVFKFT